MIISIKTSKKCTIMNSGRAIDDRATCFVAIINKSLQKIREITVAIQYKWMRYSFLKQMN